MIRSVAFGAVVGVRAVTGMPVWRARRVSVRVAAPFIRASLAPAPETETVKAGVISTPPGDSRTVAGSGIRGSVCAERPAQMLKHKADARFIYDLRVRRTAPPRKRSFHLPS